MSTFAREPDSLERNVAVGAWTKSEAGAKEAEGSQGEASLGELN